MSMITAPEGMSCVNTLHALWKNSKPAIFFNEFPDSRAPQEATISTPEKVAKLFKSQTYFDYVGGRMLKIDFDEFPELHVISYDKAFGTDM
nr:hypothetical protein [Candidatus Anoxychlamydiales bacterium]